MLGLYYASRFKRITAETRPPREREPGSGLELTPKSYILRKCGAYAFTFFWMRITRLVRAVICFLSEATISDTCTDRAATASAASCAAAVAASAASAAALAASVAAVAASVASAAAS